MTIKEIQGLFIHDFEVYKQTLLQNQEKILEKLTEENIFISALSVDVLVDKIEKTKTKSLDAYPLLGIPFAVKDNIDVFGFETTAGCKEFSFHPESSAFSVTQLEAAGAICIGKTNLDQFATGLVGVRSPYGTSKNYYNEAYIPGGSSSGSASAITAGYVPFSLGTDTAGSGRIPAAFQNLFGLKPTKGIVSTSGVVPACKSLDCVAVFANELQDVEVVLEHTTAYDAEDVYSRKNNQCLTSSKQKIAIPMKENLAFFGNKQYEKAYTSFVASLQLKGYVVEELDFSPMFEAAKLLYGGPWIAERYHAVGAFIENNENKVLKTTKEIILGGKNPLANAYFDTEYKLKGFKKIFDDYAKEYAAFVMPTAGSIYTIEEIEQDPITLNSNLGYYTNFMNLLDCSAIALPVAITENNLPFGVTLFAPAFNDTNLLTLAKSMAGKALLNRTGTTLNYIDLAVCGAHKTGGTLNYQLLDIGAVYKFTTLTAPEYRFYALDHMEPPRPGLVKDIENGDKIEVQVWKVPAEKLGVFINQIGAPLTFGKITLETGEFVTSFLCEQYAVKNAKEITQLKTWEKYVAFSNTISDII